VKHGISLATISGPNRDDRRHVLEVWTQPRLRWLLAEAYHWYDMRIYKVPGFKQLERWLQSRHRGEPLVYVPLSCRQDIRCHFLTKRRRFVVATVQLTEQQYCEISKMLYHGTCDPE
jgi:hypothetical protein